MVTRKTRSNKTAKIRVSLVLVAALSLVGIGSFTMLGYKHKPANTQTPKPSPGTAYQRTGLRPASNTSSQKPTNQAIKPSPSVLKQVASTSIVKVGSSKIKTAFLATNHLQDSDLKPLANLSGTYVVNRPISSLVSSGASLLPQHVYHALLAPNDPLYPQWYQANVSASTAWDISTGSTSIKIAVIDTGFALSHEDLSAQWAANGWDFVNNDSDPSTTVISHGTEVAGLVGAATNNAKGVASMDWNAKILPLRVLDDSGSGTTANVVSAIDYARTQGAQVINLSLGSPDSDPTLEAEINTALSAGITIVAAAGNCGDSSFYLNNCNSEGQMIYPALYPGVVSVGATDQSDNMASFSSSGPQLDLVAPGSGSIITPTISGSNTTTAYSSSAFGTSFASPIVAGTVGLIRSASPNITNSEVISALENGADKVAGMGGANRTDYYGYGRLNATKSLELATVPHPNGTLILNSSGNGVEMVQGGQAAPITSGSVFSSNNLSWSSIKSPTIADNHLSLASALSFRDGTVIGSGGHIYITDTVGGVNEKRGVTSWDSFVGLGYQISDIVSVGPSELPVANGPDISSDAQHPDGTLIYTADHSGVVLIENGQRQNITSGDVFNSYGFQWSQIKNPTSGDNSLPSGPDLSTFRDGTVIGSGGHIYITDTVGGVNEKRGVTSWDSFVGLGYSYNAIMNIGSNELPATDGSAISY